MALRLPAVLSWISRSILYSSPKKRSEFDDQYFPHRATPEFMHWVPINDPNCAIVVEPVQQRPHQTGDTPPPTRIHRAEAHQPHPIAWHADGAPKACKEA